MTDVRAIQITGNGVNDGCLNYNIPRYAGDLNQVKIKAVRSQDQRADCLNIFTYRSDRSVMSVCVYLSRLIF